jgi:Protein of unknown function (DUF2846)
MWRILLAALLLTGCVTQPPHPDEAGAKQFRPVAGKAVIYLVREALDGSNLGAAVSFDGASTGSIYPGTFYRWEAAPGVHQIAGFGADPGEIRLSVEAGKIYFVGQSVSSSRISSLSFFRQIDERAGRDAVNRAQLIAVF